MAITLDDVIKMPLQRKAIIVLFVLLVLGALYFVFYLQPALGRRMELKDNLETLTKQVEMRERIVQEIEQYKRDIARLEIELKDALAKLPEQKDIPMLLTAISEAEMSAGLINILFKPSDPVPKEFYKELPVNIIVDGAFHEIALFFDSIARLSRIVNITDIRIEHSKDKKRGNTLVANCLLKTYMFMDPAEMQKQQAQAQAKGKKDEAKDEAPPQENK